MGQESLTAFGLHAEMPRQFCKLRFQRPTKGPDDVRTESLSLRHMEPHDNADTNITPPRAGREATRRHRQHDFTMASLLRKNMALPQIDQPLLLSAACTALCLSAGWCMWDYQQYLALGPGGPPYNVRGWAWITFGIRPFALSKAGATMVTDYPADGCHEDIQQLPSRSGERARLGGIAPHRQLSQHAPKHLENVSIFHRSTKSLETRYLTPDRTSGPFLLMLPSSTRTLSR